ncbi:MAG: 23S rRNA (guanosine(2251)-2'-O)-methyltransferase RlmB [Bacteroidota bacterium]
MQKRKKPSNLVYGRHPVNDAVQAGKSVDKIIIQQGIRGEFEKEIRHLAKSYQIPLQYAPKERMNKIAGGNHQGVMAFLSPIPFQRLEHVLPLIYEKGETPLIILLDGVSDVRNFGAIARSAECSGAHAVVIPQKGAAQINAEAMKTSAGALNFIPVCRESSLAKAIELLKNSGVQVLASNLGASSALKDLDLSIPTALIVGSEGEGVSSSILRMADQQFIIPQKGQTDSFNVSVAAGIMLYEVLRQRG